MGKGGHRSGAGRKPENSRVLAWKGGVDRAVSRPKAFTPEPVAKPDLPVIASALWDELAPVALRIGTLHPTSASAFKGLCLALARLQKMAAELDAGPLTSVDVSVDGAGQEHTKLVAHPLISKVQALENANRAWLKDFGLNPFGKPLVDMTPPAVDPFGEFG